jgi:hypothetical protein
MAIGDQDIVAGLFFNDGVAVVDAAGNKANAVMDWPEEVEMLHGRLTPGIVVGKPKITYASGALNLKSDALVTVNGTRYQVCHVRRIDDGKLSVAELNKAG